MYLGAVFMMRSRVRLVTDLLNIPRDSIGSVVNFRTIAGIGEYRVQFATVTCWVASHLLEKA